MIQQNSGIWYLSWRFLLLSITCLPVTDFPYNYIVVRSPIGLELISFELQWLELTHSQGFWGLAITILNYKCDEFFVATWSDYITITQYRKTTVSSYIKRVTVGT